MKTRMPFLLTLLFMFCLVLTLAVGLFTSPAYAAECCNPHSPGGNGNYGHWVLGVCDCTPDGGPCLHICVW